MDSCAVEKAKENGDKHRLPAPSLDLGYALRAKLTLEVLFRSKWSIQILCVLRSGPIRLGQLSRLVPDASKKMLIQNLRKLEADGIIVRTDFSDLVLRVEYALNEGAMQDICVLLDHLAAWGDLYLSKTRRGRE